MNRSLIFALSVLFLVPVLATDAFAVIVFSDSFDSVGTPPNNLPGPVSPGWTQVEFEEFGFDDPWGNDAIGDCVETWDQIQNQGSTDPPSLPAWGNIHLEGGGGGAVPNFLICQSAIFTVPTSGTYDVSAYLGANPCGGCHEEARLYIYEDGTTRPVPLLTHVSDNTIIPQGFLTHDAYADTIPLTAGVNYVIDLEAYVSTGIGSGPLRAYFDDILVESNFPVGSISLPIENTALFVASGPSIPLWLAPLVLSAGVAAMGLVLVRKP